MVDTISLKNFRCFRNAASVPLKPVTILVGENSTGKSSFLAALRLAWDFAYGHKPVNFNEEPFLLGAFDQISHFRGGRGGRADVFSLSFESDIRPLGRRRKSPQATPSLRVFQEAEFCRSGSHPAICKQMLRYKDVHITATIPDGTGTPKLEIRSGNKRLNKTLDDATPFSRIAPEAPIDWMYVLFAFTQRGDSRTESDRLQSVLISDEIREIIQTSRFGGQMRPVAMAPVRSKPLRTYNPISDIPLPEGDHVPMVLAKTFFSDKSEWGRLKAAIDDFGEDSGLFTSLEIKGLGRHESDPFQIRVRIEGPPSNLVDVGYGISQVLPILVDALLSKRGSMFLLQQPEVHLHPRAQAALGTFMLKLAREQSAQLIVETHSDYLLDRLRMEIRDNEKASPGDVGILFFERNGVEVNVHSIDISENGNLNNAPESYRKFFLEEERRFLGV